MRQLPYFVIVMCVFKENVKFDLNNKRKTKACIYSVKKVHNKSSTYASIPRHARHRRILV